MATGKTPRRPNARSGSSPSYANGAAVNRSRAAGTNAYSASGHPSSQGRRPASSNHNNKKNKKRNRKRRAGPISWLLWLAAVAGVVWFVYQLIRINILPGQLLLLLCGILVVLTTLLSMIWLVYTRRPVTKFIVGGLVCVIGLGCFWGGRLLQSTDNMFEQVTNLTDKQVNSVTVYAMKESAVQAPDNLNATTTLGTASAVDMTGTTGMLTQLQNEGAAPQIVNFDNVYELVDALYAGQVDAIAFPEVAHDALYEQANDYNKYNALTTFTNNVDQYIYYEPIPEEMRNPADEVPDITKDPFTILISGADSYGNINSATRSDVNMLVTVNPVTHEVLMTSLPRDSYMEFSCKKNINACYNISGQQDKLTHSGFYGVGTTESTLEDFLGIEINYTVQVNFSSLINIVDAIGGIDVEVEPGLEVETFYANGTEGVHAGTNHLEGERALAFARERHAYLTGDNQRIINQQIVLKALLKKMLSPSMVINYPSFIRALSTAFATNMPTKQIKELIGLELAGFPSWNIQNFAVSGDSDMLYCPSLNATASVIIPNSLQVAQASSLIQDVLEGKPIDVANPSVEPNTHHNSSSGSNHSGSDTSDDIDVNQTYTDPYQEPSYYDPNFYDPGYVDPGYTNPGVNDSTWSDPGTSDPGLTDPGTAVDPGYQEPVVPEPELPSFPMDTPDLPFDEQ